jgi:hypothetical protein
VSTPESIARFRSDLTDLDNADMVAKHILSGDCHALEEDLHWRLRRQVATSLSVYPNQVVVVGSARLGFSIVERKLLRPFSDSSDIDVAIVSSDLFDEYWQLVYQYEREGGYWERGNDFKRYLFRGWMRPDLLPSSPSFEPRKRWWELFRKLTASGTYGPYKIRGGLYKSWFFLNGYHERSIAACRTALQRQ